MKKIALPLIFTFLSFVGLAQQKIVLVHDLNNGTLDSITDISFDTTITNAQTSFYQGSQTNGFASLDLTAPTENVFPSSEFTMVRRTAIDFDINQFPISAAIRLSRIIDGEESAGCSGIMISRRHALTATHCIANIGSDSLKNDSLRVSPAFDNMQENPFFGSSRVSKVYLFKNWSAVGDDLAILELEEAVGLLSGWVSIGFEENEAELLNHQYYKFSYPALPNDRFNGDTLFTNYGRITSASGPNIQIQNATGYVGQSGSSILQVVNETNYTTYGALTFAGNLSHSMIKDWQYYSMLHIIQGSLSINNPTSDFGIQVYPNPAQDYIQIQTNPTISNLEVALLNSNGQILRQSKNPNNIFIGDLPNGLLLVQLNINGVLHVKKLIKR